MEVSTVGLASVDSEVLVLGAGDPCRGPFALELRFSSATVGRLTGVDNALDMADCGAVFTGV